MKNKQRFQLNGWVLLGVNLLFLAVIICVFFAYRSDYRQQLYDQNLNDIQNLNKSAATITSNFFESQQYKLSDIVNYQIKNNLNRQELLKYIDGANSNENVDYQLIGTDCKGYRIGIDSYGVYQLVDYDNSDYEAMDRIFKTGEFENICFMPEFTDNYSGYRVLGLYTSLYLDNEDESSGFYTLMGLYRLSSINEMIKMDGGFDEMSTVIMNADGDYYLGNEDFRSDNFYTYLYIYNGLTRDEMLSIKEEVTQKETGFLEYLNGYYEDCAFVYSRIPDTEWYSVSCVPIASFHSISYDLRFTIMIVGMLLVLMIIDLLWMTWMNNKLKISVEEARSANEAKTDFLSRMSHDIRTPINVIIGMTELAQSEHNSEITTEYLGNIQSSGRFLLGLVNDILDLNKVESGKMELHPSVYAYSEFKKYIMAVIYPLCEEKNIHFTITTDREDAAIEADILRINQICFNLLSNAVKFTPENGEILLESHLGAEKDTVIFKIQDSGIGMSKEFQSHMFEVFSQEETKIQAKTVGTGLGLPIVKKLVEQMDGSIAVESEEGKGTTFTIVVRAVVLDEIVKETKEIIYDEAVLRGKRVLLCEDHPLNTTITVKLLESKGMQIDCAENGKIGFDKLSASEEGFYQVILMDIRMPVMNGLEATTAIRSLEREDVKTIPIIALTANAYDLDVENCKKAGANAHLAKPIDSRVLYQTIAMYLTQSMQR